MSKISTDIKYGETIGKIEESYDGKNSVIVVKLNNVPYKEELGHEINSLLTKYIENKNIETGANGNSYVKLPAGRKYHLPRPHSSSFYWDEKERKEKQKQEEILNGIERYDNNRLEVTVTAQKPLGSDEINEIANKIKEEIQKALENNQ